MGMPKRRTVLLSLTVAGGLALVVDKAFMGEAAAAAGSLTSFADQVQAASAVAGVLESGDPAAIQGMLEGLMQKNGTDPTAARAGLFGFTAPPPVVGVPDGSRPGGPRVSMIITTSKGGLAVVNGKPMRVGEESGGLRLIGVHQDGVEIDDGAGPRLVPLRR
jgi:hypothetical protein